MKIRDLTIQDIKTICKKTKKAHCCTRKCPLYTKANWLCLGQLNMTEQALNKEIDYEKV